MRYLELDTAKRYSVIGLGTWQFGSREWGYGSAYADEEAGRIVARARELGVTVFDTAEVYGFGRSERILGAALAASGGTDDTVVASKVFPAWPTAAIVAQRGLASAQRLGLRRIDLYQVHAPHPVVGDATTMRGMRRLRDVGIVDEVGVSNYSLRRWQRAEVAFVGEGHHNHTENHTDNHTDNHTEVHTERARVLSNQVPFSLVARAPLDEMLPWAQRTGHVVIAYSPLAQGLLSGHYTPEYRPSTGVRTTNALFLPENLDAAAPLLDALREVAAAHDATPAQIALAWVVHFRGVVAIPGASSVAQVESNAAAAEIRLADDEHAALTAVAAAFQPRTGMSALPALVRGRIQQSP